jgi:hypothetical protein
MPATYVVHFADGSIMTFPVGDRRWAIVSSDAFNAAYNAPGSRLVRVDADGSQHELLRMPIPKEERVAA